MKINLVTGTFLKEVVNSPVNGEISVIKSLAFGTYISVGNLTQSGGVVEEIWRKTLRKVHNSSFIIHNSLILGLGGGSTAKVIRKLWPDTKITGVDIDPLMIELGKKYLGLDKYEVQVQIEDAMGFLIQKSKIKTPSFAKATKGKQNYNLKLKTKNTRYKIQDTKYNLICVDLYVGDDFPVKFESDEFLRRTRTVLADNGIVVFNRLYYGEKRKQAMLFGEKLKKHFSKVDYVFPQANLMFVCSGIKK